MHGRDMGDEIVERSGRPDVDTHSDELFEMFRRGALDRHRHERFVARVFENDRPDRAHRLEHEPFRRRDLSIDAAERRSAVQLAIDEFESSTRP